jgi:hypothetical protein
MLPPVAPVIGIHETDVPLRRSAVHFGVPRSRRDCSHSANDARAFSRTREQRVVTVAPVFNARICCRFKLHDQLLTFRVSSRSGRQGATGQGIRPQGPVSQRVTRISRPHVRDRRRAARHQRSYITAMACRVWFSHLHSRGGLGVLDQRADRLRHRAGGAGGGCGHRHSGHPQA